MRKTIGFIMLLASTGCSVNNQAEVEEARFYSFKGMSMAEFMAQTMVVPSNSYDAGGLRVFVADKRAIDPRFGCSMLIETKNNGRGNGADNWIIVRTRRQGGCAQV